MKNIGSEIDFYQSVRKIGEFASLAGKAEIEIYRHTKEYHEKNVEYKRKEEYPEFSTGNVFLDRELFLRLCKEDFNEEHYNDVDGLSSDDEMSQSLNKSVVKRIQMKVRSLLNLSNLKKKEELINIVYKDVCGSSPMLFSEHFDVKAINRMDKMRLSQENGDFSFLQTLGRTFNDTKDEEEEEKLRNVRKEELLSKYISSFIDYVSCFIEEVQKIEQCCEDNEEIDAEKLNEVGKNYFRKSDHVLALIYFKKAYMKEKRLKYLNNVLACLLLLRNAEKGQKLIKEYESSQEEEEGEEGEGEETEYFRKKFNFRKVCVLISLRKLDEAEKLNDETIKDANLGKRMKRAREQSFGDFDIFSLFSSSSASRKYGIEYDYVHEHIAREKIEGKGYGYVAKEDIPFGKILVLQKPMICFTENEKFRKTCRWDPVIEYKSEFLKYTPGQIAHMFHLARVTLANPELEEKCSQLCYLGGVDDEVGLPLWYDPLRIMDINVRNSFRLPGNSERMLFFEASFFNHDCFSNTMTTMIPFGKKALMLLSTRKISKGEELVISYSNVFGKTKGELGKELLFMYNFRCGCAMCNNSKSAWKRIGFERIERFERFEGKEFMHLNYLGKLRFLESKRDKVWKSKLRKRMGKKKKEYVTVVGGKIHPQLIRWAVACLVKDESAHFGLSSSNSCLKTVYPYIEKYEPNEVVDEYRFGRFLRVVGKDRMWRTFQKVYSSSRSSRVFFEHLCRKYSSGAKI